MDGGSDARTGGGGARDRGACGGSRVRRRRQHRTLKWWRWWRRRRGRGGGGGTSGFTAVIDGQAWTATSTSRKAQVGPFGAITIQGLANGTTLLLILYNIDSVGTYPLGMGGTAVGGLGQVSDLTGRGWSTPLSGAAGSVTITTLSSGRIAGTFTYDADSSLGAAHGTRAPRASVEKSGAVCPAWPT